MERPCAETEDAQRPECRSRYFFAPDLANRRTCSIRHRLPPSCPLKDTHTRRSKYLRQTTRASTIPSPMLVSQTCINPRLAINANSRKAAFKPHICSRFGIWKTPLLTACIRTPMLPLRRRRCFRNRIECFMDYSVSKFLCRYRIYFDKHGSQTQGD